MRRTIAFSVSVVLLYSGLPRSAAAFNQPPGNFGATTFLDGGGAPPGLFYLGYAQHVLGREAVDRNGDVIAGGGRVSVLVQLHQLYYQSPVKVFGAYLGLETLVPVVSPSAKGMMGAVPLSANTAGLGDVTIGAALQWNDSKLLGRPFFHRFETYVTLPTGGYDSGFSLNPGSNLWTVEPYYAFTWMFAKKWETSWRLIYGFHGENNDTRIRPGQLFHMNYAVSRAVHPRLRLGAAGYFLQQTTGDKVAGAAADGSKERAFALGPGLVYAHPSFLLMISHPIEFGVRNRFRGDSTTLQFIHRF